VPNARVILRQGDTDLIPTGGATAARARPTWRHRDLARLRRDHRKGRRVASDALEAAEADIVFEAGIFTVAGTDRRIGLMAVAERARAAGTPLDTYHAWTREAMTFRTATHVVEVEIDRDTGAVTWRATPRATTTA